MRPTISPDQEIIFAAKTGFLTRKLWQDFFAEGSPSWRHKRWNHLVERGFFKPHPSALAKEVVVLNQKNAVVRKLVGEEISLAPFVSQLDHDEIVARILLDLKQRGAIHSFQTEMELKKADQAWQRMRYHSDRIKYPDAVIELAGPEPRQKIAIELELTRKDPKRYRQCLNAYATRNEIQRVIFIARSKGIFDSLTRAMRDTFYPDLERPIGFSLLAPWLLNSLKAEIHFAEETTSLGKITTKTRS